MRIRNEAVARLIQLARMDHGTINLSVWNGVAWLHTDHSFNVDTPITPPPSDEAVSDTEATQHAGRVLAELYNRQKAVFQISVARGQFVHLRVLWRDTPPWKPST